MIPLVKLRYATPFVEQAGQTLGSLDRLFDQTDIPEELLANTSKKVPIFQFEKLIRQSVVLTEDFDIGWKAASSLKLSQYGGLGDEISSRETLPEKLNAFCDIAKTEYSLADFYIERTDWGLCFKRGPIAGGELERRQTELYVVYMMIDTIRSVLGSHWCSPRLSLQTFQKQSTEALLQGLAGELRFDQRETSIVIPAKDIAHSLGHGYLCEHYPSGTSNENEGRTPQNENPVTTVSELISSYLADPRLSQTFIARICGLHPRNLQRLLETHETSFRVLLKHQRIAAATELLQDPDVRISEIANALGYSEQGHFTRAFRRETGLSPRQFRNEVGTFDTTN